MADVIRVLEVEEMQALELAMQRLEIAELKAKLAITQARGMHAAAIRKVGLDPAKTYEINPETREVSEATRK